MKHPWFKKTNFGAWPAHWLGWVLTFLVLGLDSITFIAVDSTSHSVSDTLISAFPGILFFTVIGLFIMYFTSEKQYWFAAKRYGWGWTPNTWQGWLVIILALGALGLATSVAQFNADTDNQFIAELIPSAIVIVLLLVSVSWATGEPPRWRWGNNK